MFECNICGNKYENKIDALYCSQLGNTLKEIRIENSNWLLIYDTLNNKRIAFKPKHITVRNIDSDKCIDKQIIIETDNESYMIDKSNDFILLGVQYIN